eukprot:GHVU01209655.1.p2 GENE.GHVU01209655.1~~GHVU01209655.1.p2  ORF type:complete len:226 (-),score=27.43 GHVU01209655.1:985-1662(-)
MGFDGSVMFPKASSYGRGRGSPSVYDCAVRFDCLKANTRRTQWVFKDICRFHGDETLMATGPSVASVCVGDYVEIAITLANAFGLVSPSSIRWKPLTFVSGTGVGRGRTCELERIHNLWLTEDTFDASNAEVVNTSKFFQPQMAHVITEYAGIDVTCSRSAFKVVKAGAVADSRRLFGMTYVVVPKSERVVCGLKRLGMQHDRNTPNYLRVGDIFVVYISQGGGF